MLATAERVANRYIPNGSKELKDDHCVVYLYDTVSNSGQERFIAIGYRGTAGRPAFHISYRTPEARLQSVNAWRMRVAQRVDERRERQEQRRNYQHTLEVGSILVSTWGYEQTNVDFYQVTEVNGKFVTIREIGKDSKETGWLQGDCRPVADSFVGDPLRRMVTQGNYVKIESWGQSAHLWDGTTRHWTAYA